MKILIPFINQNSLAPILDEIEQKKLHIDIESNNFEEPFFKLLTTPEEMQEFQHLDKNESVIRFKSLKNNIKFFV